jgi:hypothetical protein
VQVWKLQGVFNLFLENVHFKINEKEKRKAPKALT